MAGPTPEMLRQTVERIQRLSDEHWWTLDPTCGLMSARAWVGPAGDRFGTAVQADRNELRRMLSEAVHSARTELASLPEESP